MREKKNEQSTGRGDKCGACSCGSGGTGRDDIFKDWDTPTGSAGLYTVRDLWPELEEKPKRPKAAKKSKKT
jgi:hypothetical protein